jgi:hypothetical protein
MVKSMTSEDLKDFKLLQLSWISDLNYELAFRLLIDRDYIGRIIAKLPLTEAIQKLSVFLAE